MPTLPPVAAGTPVDAVPTPALIVDERRLHANLDRAQAYADANGVALRPHAKTHKSPALAREQIERGAVGICVSEDAHLGVTYPGEVAGARVDPDRD